MDKLTNEMIQLIVNEYREEFKFADDFPQVLRGWKVQSRGPEIKKYQEWIVFYYMHHIILISNSSYSFALFVCCLLSFVGVNTLFRPFPP